MGLAANWWQYLLLFVAVTASWAGVPAIGTAAAGAAGAAASQGTLDFPLVVLVTTAGGEVGGLLGYAIGIRWGRELLGRPGRHLEARQQVMARGERAYARWGRIAVFVTPAIVSGTAKMAYGQFALWNLLASAAFAISVCASAYGLGRLVTGNTSLRDVLTLLAGLLASVALLWWYRVRRRRARARRAHATDGAAG
jgi:membrane protein DedA with SNARE-associated domain